MLSFLSNSKKLNEVNEYGESIETSQIIYMGYIIECISRYIHQRNSYTVNKIGVEGINHFFDYARDYMAEHPDDVVETFIGMYSLEKGDFDISDIPKDLNRGIPSEMRMGEKYGNLVLDTKKEDESYAEAFLRVYNNSYCDILDDYGCDAFEERYENLLLDYKEYGVDKVN